MELLVYVTDRNGHRYWTVKQRNGHLVGHGYSMWEALNRAKRLLMRGINLPVQLRRPNRARGAISEFIATIDLGDTLVEEAARAQRW